MIFTTEKEICTINGGGCCSPKPKGKMECVECSTEAKAVLSKTLNALLTNEAKESLKSLEGFYYCKTSNCKVVYFKEDIVLSQSDLKVEVGLKDGAIPATLCYCFGWSKEKIKSEIQETGDTEALSDIKSKMENPGCNCEVLNPSGGCCLGDVGKAIKDIKRQLS